MADIRVVIQKPVNGVNSGVQTVTGDGVGGTATDVVMSFPDGTEVELVDGGGVSVTQAITDLDNTKADQSDLVLTNGQVLNNTLALDTKQNNHTVTDYTDAFTIPNGTNNATLTMTNAVDKNVTVTTISFSSVGDGCELSSLLGVGFPIVVAGTDVELIDPDGIAIDTFNVKGLRRMNDVGGKVQIQMY